MDVTETLAVALLESSPDGLLLVDPNGTITLANPAAERIFGRPQEDLVGSTVESLVPAEQRERHVGHRSRYSNGPVQRPMGSGLRLLAEHADGSLFPVEISLSPIDLDEVMTIATVRDVTERQAALARAALHEERERIARDLHDFVIQHLFAAGMSLEAVAQQMDAGSTADRVRDVTDQLDDTITEIRRAIFRLGQHDVAVDLVDRLAEIVEGHVAHLGFEPVLRFHGAVDAVPAEVGEHLAATLTEALSNVARHARASSVEIVVGSDERELLLEIVDDGDGISGSAKPLGGLSNMIWRAEQLGGDCTFERIGPDGGTALTWSVPILDPHG